MNPNVTSKVYPWQKTTWDTLITRFPNIGHGLLFYGKQGCGKHAFAKHFLAWVLCLNKQVHGACGECSSCQWLKSDTHPNYVHITTDEENKKQNAKIKIEKIRDLLPFVQQTGEGWRVILIEPAEALNLASSNALLKTLEEPGERVVLILLADHYLKLPATIRSRLQHFALDRISYEQATSYLDEHLSELAEVQPDLLLGLSNDMPLQAIEIAKSDWFAKRQIFLNDWLKIVAQKNMPLFFSGKWQKELSFNDFIVLFEYLLGDLICVKLNQPQKNTDLDFDQLSPYYDLESLFNIYSELQQAKKLVEQNVQSQLIIDQLFITLMNI
ncbi:DNA polymerase III subunit tau [Acinetobacter calcoaceticus]|uniref:DNA-directed DNA polymerase n=1 Tax=Acinetobacter calcoaceticus DSM 30006 = CIP 81.8 TaxID=981331 RepID=A0ABP2UG50_ACICA|nr:DNA polymerase III, delta' subunit [Acinetobacter calcoaceticus]ENV99189.1 DNA polymerase III, delta' subunit [Acinetobacter calcoaceticus DSM 30006 = CIP 81.8]CAI3114764.1 DNA polymerase III subunit tau [Acinetobacter calcoaceticus]SUU54862.1 DNA polymerase III subunit delta' [Acinetobacter calcoaceticus]